MKNTIIWTDSLDKHLDLGSKCPRRIALTSTSPLDLGQVDSLPFSIPIHSCFLISFGPPQPPLFMHWAMSLSPVLVIKRCRF